MKTSIKLFALILCINFLTLSNATEEWTGNCLDASAYQSPININGPFSFMTMNLQMSFREVLSGHTFLENKNGRLIIKGDFGYINHDSINFSSYEIDFKSPSEHSVGNTQTFFPLEVQIKFSSSVGTKLNMAFLFSYGAESDFLNRLGFGREVLRNLKANQDFEIPSSFNLQTLLPQKNRFFVYRGSDTTSPCEPTVWLIGYDTLKLTQKQLNDFPKTLSYTGRDVQKKKQEIFINFDIKKSEEKKSDDASEKQGEAEKTQPLEELNRLSQPLNANLTAEQVNELSKIRQSFVLLGDPTIYDPFVFGHSSSSPTQFIKDSDYVVVKSENPKQQKEEAAAQEIEQIIFEKISEEKDQESKSQDQKKGDGSNKKEEETEKKNEGSEEEKEVDSKDEQKQEKQNEKAEEAEKEEKGEDENEGEESKEQEESKEDQTAPETDEKDENSDKGKSKKNKQFVMLPNQQKAQIQTNMIEKNQSTKPNSALNEKSWPELCISGKNQSPVDLDSTGQLLTKEDGELIVYYDQDNQDPLLINDGHKLTLKGSFGTVELKEHLFDAYIVQINTPSEHLLDGKRADIEFQIEHNNVHGNKLILSVLGKISPGHSNPFLEELGIPDNSKSNHEKVKGEKVLKNTIVSLDQLIEELPRYYRYLGSLSYPPCTEGIIRVVSRDLVAVTQAQVEGIKQLIGEEYSYRGNKDLNGRSLFVR